MRLMVDPLRLRLFRPVLEGMATELLLEVRCHFEELATKSLFCSHLLRCEKRTVLLWLGMEILFAVTGLRLL